ncbi:MAG: hypothetical protein QUV05_16035 [Phycisphaerae bacterium]|nr:hypothetical protein [Phycisphaerae bacterium]
MARLGRKGRILKWAGLVIIALITVSWAVSIRWMVWYHRVDLNAPAPPGMNASGFFGSMGSVYLCRGRVVCADFCSARRPYPQYARPGPGIGRASTFNLPLMRKSRQINAECPLWMPLVFFAIPTVYLFWHDRRIPPGHCQSCGYNLTGNVSGVCPECGEKVIAGARKA